MAKQNELFPEKKRKKVNYPNTLDRKKPVEKVSSKIDLYSWCCGIRTKVGKSCPRCGTKIDY